MSKFRGYLKRILNMDFKQMLNIAKQINIKTKKITIFIIFDMLYCSIKYSAGYMDYHEYEFYYLNKNQRKTYMTTGINNRLVNKFNKEEFKYKFQNKSTFNEIFKDFIGRQWLNLNQAEEEEFVKFLKNKKKIIVKPNEDYAGNGIEVINIDKKTDGKKLYKELLKNKQELVEEVVENHKTIKKVYSKALNTLRIITFFDGSKTHILTTIIKFGNGGVIDNFATGGLYMFVNEEGKIYTDAIDKNGNILENHPITKVKFKGFEVPLFKEAVQLAKDASKIIPEIPYVGWDVAILDEKPIIIEGNQSSGAFQIKASMNETKTGFLPIYEKAMGVKIYRNKSN